ncbi:MAG: ATP-binding cassette domain-containing protein [Christensenellales bacterium]|jgi:ABC-2 type transport system ATP-binding protein
MLETQKLVKRYDRKLAVSSISFTVRPGEIFGLLGPNGAGKSTTINIITGLIRKDEGKVIIDGLDLDSNLTQCKYRMGIVPQDLAVYNDLTAEQNIRFFGSLYGMKGAELTQSVQETLQFVGLTERRRDKVKTFSGGMKRRLNIACGLVHRPKLLILDEPTVGIDPQSRNHIMEAIMKLNAQGMTILYTTHYMEEAQQLCNRIAIMDMGQIIAQGTLPELRALVEEHWYITMTLKGEVPVEELRSAEGVAQIDVREHSWRFTLKQKKNQLRDLLDVLTHHHIEITDMAINEPDLEDIFLTLTGRSLRD